MGNETGGKEMQQKLKALEDDLAEHKRHTARQFEEVKSDLDNRVGKLYRQVQSLHNNSDRPNIEEDIKTPPDIEIDATPDARYATAQTKSAILLATNAFNFTGPKDAYVKIEARGRNMHVISKRPVRTPEAKQQAKYGTAMFPCAVIGSLNGREASWMDTNKVRRLPGKRQYSYPVHDLEQVNKLCGLPSTVRDIKQLKVIVKNIRGKMGATNGFLDKYLHNEEWAGDLTGNNAINGNFTKGLNINTWFVHPKEFNTAGLANGWTGSEKIGSRRINDVNVDIGLKVERVNGNEFLYCSIVPESKRAIDWDCRKVLDWVLEDFWQMVRNSEKGRALLATMERQPIAPHDLMRLCGLHLGNEVWYTEDEEEEEVIWEDLEFQVNGKSYFLDSTIELNMPDDIPVSRPPEPAKPAPVNGSNRTQDVIFKRTGQRKALPGSQGGGNIDNLSQQGILDNEETRYWPKITIVAKTKGTLEIDWTDKQGKKWVTRVVV